MLCMLYFNNKIISFLTTYLRINYSDSNIRLCIKTTRKKEICKCKIQYSDLNNFLQIKFEYELNSKEYLVAEILNVGSFPHWCKGSFTLKFIQTGSDSIIELLMKYSANHEIEKTHGNCLVHNPGSPSPCCLADETIFVQVFRSLSAANFSVNQFNIANLI